MQHIDIVVSVYLIPGGENASLVVYEHIVDLLQAHEDLTLTIYRLLNKPDGQWIVTLIGEREPFTRYQPQIQRILAEGQAEQVSVPRERLTPLIKRFLESRVTMAMNRTPFIEKHYLVEKKYYRGKRRQ